MTRAKIEGRAAVVAATPDLARFAARALARRFPRADLVPCSAAEFLRRIDLGRLVLAAPVPDAAEGRRFLEGARGRLLWDAPRADLYAAIAGVLTRLPQRGGGRGKRDGALLASALLLEGDVDTARAAAALATPARRWIVERPGCVRMTATGLARLHRAGVRWSVLEPLELLGVAVASTAAAGSLFPDVPVWRIPASPVSALRSPGRARTPSRK